MGRRAARDIAMKLLYQLEIQKEDREEQIEHIFGEEVELTNNDKKYITEIIDGTFENLKIIDDIIEKYSKGWKIARLSKVDLSILRLSIFEINYRKDIPFNVSINEAVELAKLYSSADAGAFVNGLLGKVAKIDILDEEKVELEEE